jgi:light-regulated signal transduction histidine kinase (bacteriophytochrome)
VLFRSFTSLLGLFLLVVFGRGRKIEQQVVARTSELHRSNEELSHELAQGERLRRETLARAEELAAINQEVEQLGYIVSHDLSAPLRSVGNFAQLLERRAAGVLDENGREFLGLIREGVNEMQRLIDALVRMSRVSGTRLKLELLDSRRLVQRVLQALHVEIETQHADIKLEELPRVYADEDLLRQLFQQLIGNALLYRRPESPPQVRISAHAADGEWHFAVADSGTGLSAQNVPRLFQVFRRFHPASQYPGTGVGLAICRKIVRLHGGRIWAESTEGQGSTFHFTLPQEPVRGRGEATAH